MFNFQPSRRRIWKALGGSGAAVGMGVLAAARGAKAQASGQNFDVITWKRFPVPTQDFSTTSNTWTPSNMPAAGGAGFVKQQSGTYLWMICNFDYVPSSARTVFMGMYVDGSPVLLLAQSGYAGDIQTCSMSEIILVPAGTRQCQIYVAVEPGTSCNFLTTVCSFTVMEVAMPPQQT